jgi:heme-degrading monooxygenase HmoA
MLTPSLLRYINIHPQFVHSNPLNPNPFSYPQFLSNSPKMPVTELAILPLTQPPNSPSFSLSPALLTKLRTAKTALETASGHKFHYFQQLEDPSLIYTLGTWDSVQAHRDFLPSPENLSLLELLKDDILMEGEKKIEMWHLDSDIFGIQRAWEGEGGKSVFTAPVISVNRHFVESGKKDEFVGEFEEVTGILEEYTKPFGVVGGWGVEKEKEREEWVLFSGFESVEQHHGFAKTEGFGRYRGIVEFVERFEVRHLRAVEGL